MKTLLNLAVAWLRQNKEITADMLAAVYVNAGGLGATLCFRTEQQLVEFGIGTFKDAQVKRLSRASELTLATYLVTTHFRKRPVRVLLKVTPNGPTTGEELFSGRNTTNNQKT